MGSTKSEYISFPILVSPSNQNAPIFVCYDCSFLFRVGEVHSWDRENFPRTHDDSTRFVCAGRLVEFSDELTEAQFEAAVLWV